MRKRASKKPRTRLQKFMLWGMIASAVFAVVVAFFVLSFVIYTLPRLASKHEAERSLETPIARTESPIPILQFENHTCGFLALSAAYTVYGLSPETKNIRFRLGVDREAHPFDDASTGTLHPDLLRVIVQDGFDYQCIDLEEAGAQDQLCAHLDSGELAMVLIKMESSGGLHWVLASACESEALWIVDSLKQEPYREPAQEFLNSRVLSIVLIEPAAENETVSLASAYADGTNELLRVHKRMKGLAGVRR